MAAETADEKETRLAAIGHLKGTEFMSTEMRPRVAALLRKVADKLDPAPAPVVTAPVAPKAAPETPFARFETQYAALPKGNILAEGSTWEAVASRLYDIKNAEQLAKVLKEMDEPRLYAVLLDGSLEFVDGNPATPPMFVKDKKQHAKDGTLQIIFKRDPEQMSVARAQIGEGKAEWASIQEMLDWATKNGFEVFNAYNGDSDKRDFGKLMKLAEAASPTKRFVGQIGGGLMATALKDARSAYYDPAVGVRVRGPGSPNRDDRLGLLRRINI